MADYRIHLKGRPGQADRMLNLSCEDDEQAVQCLTVLAHGGAVEMWQAHRLVVRLPPQPAPSNDD